MDFRATDMFLFYSIYSCDFWKLKYNHAHEICTELSSYVSFIFFDPS